jgi:hypothetical protein
MLHANISGMRYFISHSPAHFPCSPVVTHDIIELIKQRAPVRLVLRARDDGQDFDLHLDESGELISILRLFIQSVCLISFMLFLCPSLCLPFSPRFSLSLGCPSVEGIGLVWLLDNALLQPSSSHLYVIPCGNRACQILTYLSGEDVAVRLRMVMAATVVSLRGALEVHQIQVEKEWFVTGPVS